MKHDQVELGIYVINTAFRHTDAVLVLDVLLDKGIQPLHVLETEIGQFKQQVADAAPKIENPRRHRDVKKRLAKEVREDLVWPSPVSNRQRAQQALALDEVLSGSLREKSRRELLRESR